MPEKKSPYTGELAKKLPRGDEDRMAAAVREGDRDALSLAFHAQYERKRRKLDLLIKHFEIEQEDDSLAARLAVYRDLAMQLAERHVPGFQVEGSRGRPKEWNKTLRVKAAIALGRLSIRHPRFNQEKLAALLHKEAPWSELSRTPGALLKQIRLLNSDYDNEPAALTSDGRPVNRLMEILLRRQNGTN